MSLAALLACAMALDAWLGEPNWLWSRLPHPAVLMGRCVSTLDKAMNQGAARRAKGLLALICLVSWAVGLGVVLSWGGAVVEILIAAILLAQRSLVQHVQAVADGLERSLQEGREAVAMIVSRDCREMDSSSVARSALESAAENLSDGVIAPAFWFLVAGLPGLIAYKVINTADSMIGYRNPRYLQFGRAAARCDDLMNLIPARLTGLMIALLARQLPRWVEIAQDARLHRSPNAGWPEAAMARALDIALAGPRSYDGQMRDLPWVNGSARRDLAAADIRAGIVMLWRVWLFTLILCFSLAILHGILSA